MNDIVTRNKVVYITYAILNDEGRVLEQYDLPVGYVHGAQGPLIAKIEQALEGHAAGDRIEVVVAPEEGFGEPRPELTFTDDIENVPPEHRHLGSEVTFENEKGEQMLFRVTRIENGKLTIDANHPLAGKTLKFVVTVTGIRDASLEEIANGEPREPGAQTLH